MIGIKALTVILFLLFVSSCTEKKDKLDCSIVTKGKFEYRGGYTNKQFSIERDDSIQIEKDEDTGLGMKFKIEWNGPCDYTLTPLSFIINGRDSSIGRAESRRMKTGILKVTKNYYVCRSTIDGENIFRSDTMLIIK